MTVKSEKVMCPYCKEIEGRKQGINHTVNSAPRQRYLCKACGRSWY